MSGTSIAVLSTFMSSFIGPRDAYSAEPGRVISYDSFRLGPLGPQDPVIRPPPNGV